MSVITEAALATACLTASSRLVWAVAVISSVSVVTGTMLFSSHELCSTMITRILFSPSLCDVVHLYASPQDVDPTSDTWPRLSGLLSPCRTEAMQDRVSELRRIHLPRTSVNKAASVSVYTG